MSELFREQLLAVAGQAAFPMEQTLDPDTGEATLDPESEATMQQVFDMFGVSALSPTDKDYDKVINTVCTLATEVAAHVQDLTHVSGAMSAMEDASDWNPDYRAYVSALWQGDKAEIARCAICLGLAGGIPNGSLPLKDGPLG